MIQNSQNRDGAAIQAKLDELLRAVEQARPQFIGIEHLTDKQIEMIRRALDKQATAAHEKFKQQKQSPKANRPSEGLAEHTVDRLLDRY